ncbi:hypothetical protein [Paraburkholderia phosphatilytica]|uniref:hypothetical protein n=1 Tax=Paraburkholderia phosphatilytica TaxID=2282883 RepID=UPI000E48E64E|nr:hypothetical protein [Paraburkholderia phosphatilytica]
MTLLLLLPSLLGKLFKFAVAHWRIAVALLAAVVLLGTGYHFGSSRVQAKWDAAKVATAKAVAKVNTAQVAQTAIVQTKVVTKLQVIHDKGATITKEVIRYVPLSTPDLPYGFRLLHDAAAAGVPLPATPSGVDGPAVPAATVAETVSDNYAGCRADAAIIRGWQRWAQRELATTDGAASAVAVH